MRPDAELHSYNQALPLMMVRYLGPGLLGLGITALIAGFMSGMAGNVSAFSTVWTYDIYKPLINKKGSDSHYVMVGRLSILIGVAVSIGAAYLVHARARHHGLRAGAVQHLCRAAAGHHSVRHVLEARHQAGRLPGPAARHRLFGQPVHVGQARSLRRWPTWRFRPTPSRWPRMSFARCGHSSSPPSSWSWSAC